MSRYEPQEQFVKDLHKFAVSLNKQSIRCIIRKYLFKAIAFPIAKSLTEPEDVDFWIRKLRVFYKQEQIKRKQCKGIERKISIYWLRVHKIPIDLLKIHKELNKLNASVKNYEEEFIKTPNYTNAIEYQSALIKKVQLVKKTGFFLKKKADSQEKIIKIWQEQKNKKQTRLGKAILTDVFACLLSENKFPVATSVELTYKFGPSVIIHAWNQVFQTKTVYWMSQRLCAWSCIVEQKLDTLNNNYQKA